MAQPASPDKITASRAAKEVSFMVHGIIIAIHRYIDDYGWSWNMARRLINRAFHTQFTEAELKTLYRQ